ncbi:hypothetical protein SDC9_18894 [bioreactor metagenome]|uniref:Uncharacterized protein n=1 Tax=bioreactor metagenome TaxID=1076179 RepID=A0A644U3W9_9ZZZZ
MRAGVVAAIGLAGGAVKPVERDELQAVDADPVAHLVLGHLRGEQLVAVRRVDAIEARPGGRRRGDTEMHLGRAGIEDHLLDLARGGAAHDRVVDQDHPLALHQRLVHVQLQPHAHVADLLGRLDEGAAHVLVAGDAKGEGDARFLAEADRRGRARIRHRADEIGLDRSLAGQFHPDLAPRLIDRAAADDAVGAREIDMFEDAEPRRRPMERACALDLAVLDHHHLAGLDLAHEMRADDVEAAGFGGQHIAVVADPAEHQRPHAERVAHADELGAGHRDDREGALAAAQRVGDAVGMGLLERARHQMDDAFAVRARLEDRAMLDQFAAQRLGIGQVAVVRDCRAAHRELAEEGLDVADHRGLLAGGRIAHVADGEGAGQGLHQRGLGEVVAHIAEAVRRVEALLGIMGDDAARLLAAVLQRVQAKGDEIRRIGHTDHAEDAAFLLQLVVVERMRQEMRFRLGHGGSPSPACDGGLRGDM